MRTGFALGQLLVCALVVGCSSGGGAGASNAEEANETATAQAGGGVTAHIEANIDHPELGRLAITVGGKTLRYAPADFSSKFVGVDVNGAVVLNSGSGIRLISTAVSPKTSLVALAVSMSAVLDGSEDLLFVLDPAASGARPKVLKVYGAGVDAALGGPTAFEEISEIGYGRKKGTLNVVTADESDCVRFFLILNDVAKQVGAKQCET
jgi:hypothetical protein